MPNVQNTSHVVRERFTMLAPSGSEDAGRPPERPPVRERFTMLAPSGPIWPLSELVIELAVATHGISPERVEEWLRGAVANMEGDEGRVARRRLFDEQPGPEVAAALGLSRVAVAELYGKAVTQLRRAVPPEWRR